MNLFEEKGKDVEIFKRLFEVTPANIKHMKLPEKIWVLKHLLEIPPGDTGAFAYKVLWDMNSPLVPYFTIEFTRDCLSENFDACEEDVTEYRVALTTWMDAIACMLRPNDYSRARLTRGTGTDGASRKQFDALIARLTPQKPADAANLKAELLFLFTSKQQQTDQQLQEASAKSTAMLDKIQFIVKKTKRRLARLQPRIENMAQHKIRQLDKIIALVDESTQMNADIQKLKKSVKDNDASIANIRNDVSTVDIKIKELVKKKEYRSKRISQSTLDQQHAWTNDLKYLTEQLHLKKALCHCDEKCQRFYHDNTKADTYDDIKTKELMDAWQNFVEEVELLAFNKWLKPFAVDALDQPPTKKTKHTNKTDQTDQTIKTIKTNKTNKTYQTFKTKQARLTTTTTTTTTATTPATTTAEKDKSLVGTHNIVFHSRNPAVADYTEPLDSSDY